MKKLAALMRKHNFFTIKTGGFTCPNNGWITLFSPKSVLCRDTKYEPKLREKIAKYTDDVVSSLDAYDKKPYCVGTKVCLAIMFISRLLETMEGLVMQKHRVEYDKCISCGLCIRKCPDHNIEFDENQKVIFVNPNKCTWCLRCISDCPKGAINFGWLITGKGWYTKDLRNEYLKKLTKLENIYGIQEGKFRRAFSNARSYRMEIFKEEDGAAEHCQIGAAERAVQTLVAWLTEQGFGG